MVALRWVLTILLVVAWFVGYAVAHVGGTLINLLLLAALVLFVWNVLSTPRSA